MGWYAGRWYAGPKDSSVCSHVKFNLKGCNRLANHDGMHRNIFDSTNEYWSDDAGRYINTQKEWIALVKGLGNPKMQVTITEAQRRLLMKIIATYGKSSDEEELKEIARLLHIFGLAA